MIQRIQTIFMLLFVTTAGANFFFFFSEEIIFQPLLGDQSGSSPYISFLLALVVIINIGLFKKRPLQIQMNRFVWILHSVFWGGFVYLILQHQADQFSNYLPDLLLAFLGEVCLLLANRYIRKDEALVRSLDRLR